jgi:murein DD-endopeptidase MepM/ murein hydrolase activator NlpD
MAITSPLLRSNINLNNIKKNTVSLNKSFKSIEDSTLKINSVLLKKTRVKRESIANDRTIFQKRRESVRRRERESIIEASGIGGAVKRQSRVISESTKGFLGRILDFVGSLMTGWLLYNLPTIISMGKALINRIQRLTSVLGSFVTNTIQILSTFTNLLGGIASDVLTFNFGNIENQINLAMQDLDSAFKDMGRSFDEGVKLLTTPLGESEGEEPVPQAGTDYDRGGYRGLSPEEQALIATVRQTEGTAGATGYNKFFGGSQYGGDLSQKTVSEVVELQKKFLKEGRGKFRGGTSAVVGAGQFRYPAEVVAAMGLDPSKEKFTPELQNRMILFVAKEKRKVDPTKPLTKKDIQILNEEWSGLGPRYSQTKRTIDQSFQIYQRELAQARQASTSTTSTRTAPAKPITPIITGRMGDPRGRGRKHGGSDLAAPMGTPLRAISDGQIIDSGVDPGGWGNFLVMRDDQGILHLYGHIQGGYKKGGRVKKGEEIAKVGMTGRTTGPHLHWESGTGWTGRGPGTGGVLTGKFDPLNRYSKYLPFNTIPSERDEAKPTPAEVSTTAKPPQPSAVTPERRGQDIVVPFPTPSQPSANMPPMAVSGGGEFMNEPEPLNRFMITRLLLDLAYT